MDLGIPQQPRILHTSNNHVLRKHTSKNHEPTNDNHNTILASTHLQHAIPNNIPRGIPHMATTEEEKADKEALGINKKRKDRRLGVIKSTDGTKETVYS